MSRLWLLRWGWLLALGAGVLWIADDLAAQISPDPDDWDCNSTWDYWTNALDPAAFWLNAAAVYAVHLRQRERAGRLGAISATAAIIGSIGAGINNPIEHCGDVEALGFVLWAPSTVLLTLGMLLFGIATIRARVVPIWAGAALIAGTVAIIAATENGGMIILGLAWIAVSLAMRRVRA